MIIFISIKICSYFSKDFKLFFYYKILFCNKGCTSDCKGIIKGWHCSSGINPASVCITQLGDGIHVSPEESCDDGNLINGDGCSSSGTIETNWDCYDDILQKSVCVARCGNSKRNNPDEGCDDGNSSSGDGCSSKCQVETGYQCFGGSTTTQDNCYKQPTAKIDSVSQSNYIQIKFSEKMTQFQPQNNSSYSITITGPYSPYEYTIVGSFTDAYTLSFNCTFISQMYGQNGENFKVTFDKSQFKSLNGATLSTSYLEASLYRVSLTTDAVKVMGSTINSAMSISIVVLFNSKLLRNN